MNSTHISEALNMIEEDMLIHTEGLRSRESQNRSRRIAPKIIAVAAAAFALCSVSAFAAINGGIFTDIKNWNGAITGTRYENATEEIAVCVAAANDMLNVQLDFIDADKAPYPYIEGIAISRYTISDSVGNVIINGTSDTVNVVDNMQVSAAIPIGQLESGEYTITITELTASSKADADLIISAEWKCDFSYN